MKKSTEIIVYILFLFTGVQMILLSQFAYPFQHTWIARHSIAEIQGRYGEFDYIEIQDDSDTKIGYYVVIPEYHGILGDQPAVVYAITYWDHSPNDWIESHGWRRCYLPD
jgi:hypothetical protein